LISNVDAEAAPGQTNEKGSGQSLQRASGKGLEFHTVFVIWLTDGMFPAAVRSTLAMRWRKTALVYVAILGRATSYISPIRTCALSGGYGDVFQRPSRFLQEIPNELVEDWQVRENEILMPNDKESRMKRKTEVDPSEVENPCAKPKSNSGILRSLHFAQDDNLIIRIRIGPCFVFVLRLQLMNLSLEKRSRSFVPLFALRGRTIWDRRCRLRCGSSLIGLRKLVSRLFSFCQLTKRARITAPTMPLVRWRSSQRLCTSGQVQPEDLTRNDFAEALSDTDVAGLRRGRVKYRQVKELKQRILEKALRISPPAPTKATIRIRTVLRRRIVLVRDYALFRVLIEQNKGSAAWDQWPQQHQTTEMLAIGCAIFREKQTPLTRRLDFFCYVQWIAHSNGGTSKRMRNNAA
jgi:hypothetical protein